MCGRYDLNALAQEVAARFGTQLSGSLHEMRNDDARAGVNSGLITGVYAISANLELEWRPRYNIAPGQHNPVVVRDAGGHNNLELMRWGLVPSWSKEVKLTYSTINARAETVASKPAFRKPLATQRCLVPATGYFEWVDVSQAVPGSTIKENRWKQPYRIQLRNKRSRGADEIMAFAGLYDVWQGPDGEELQTYTIVTTQANRALSSIHSRMPVILPSGAEAAWLDRDNTDIEKLISLLQPYPEDLVSAYPVSRLVNSPVNDRPELLEPVVRLAS